MRLRSLLTSAALVVTSLVVAPAATGSSGASSEPAVGSQAGVPPLSVRVVARGLDLPWDVAGLPDGNLLVTERARFALTVVNPTTGATTVVATKRRGDLSRGETGMMGLALDPDFTSNRRFYTCQGSKAGRRRDIRVLSWRLEPGNTVATRTGVLVSGIPVTSGTHGGCKVLAVGEVLYVGTGDAKRGRLPQRLRSLAGKVLRLHKDSGAPMPDNPWAQAKNWNKRYVWNYGHRNIQGLALRANGQIYSVEHGTKRDDEINVVLPGANYGWAPGRRYNEKRPMTDHRLKGVQTDAVWRSGRRTWATSGATFVSGAQWGALEGTLAVASLKDSKVAFMRFGGDVFLGADIPAELKRFGRLRSVQQLPSGDLAVTTSNGGGKDKLLVVHPG